MKKHSKVTLDRVMNAVESQTNGTNNPGFCIACGNEQEDCEPDAREYKCEECGENEVYGAEELLMMIGG